MALGHKRKRYENDASDANKLAAIVHEGPVKRDLLRQTYPSVLTLREYTLLKLPRCSRLRRKKITSLGKASTATKLEGALSTFLDSTLICGPNVVPQSDDAAYEQWLSFSQRGDDSHVTLSGGIQDSETTQSELVDFVIWSLFRREKKPGAWPKQLLCDGFRKRAKESDPHCTSIPDVYSLYPNHHAAALKQEPWPHVLALLGRSGQKVMIDLLSERSVFATIGAGIGNYYQLSGIPLSELDLSGKANVSTEARKPTDISLVRSRIFYSKPALTARGRVQLGYKHIHVLNRCRSKEDDKLDANTMKVTMHMFPRQFGLHNVFTSDVSYLETAQKFQDYTLREREITEYVEKSKRLSKDRMPKLPKRLRGRAWSLVRRLQLLHGRCSYGELLKHYCPSEVDKRRVRVNTIPVDERDQVLTPKPLKYNVHTSTEDSTNRHEETMGSLHRQHTFKFNSLVDLATPTSQVSAFCQSVLSSIVPNDFWGQGETMCHNKNTILSKVDHFIKLRRFESMSLHEIFQGIKIADIPWLQPPGSQNQKASQTDMTKRLELFHELLYYIFDSLLIPLIAATFYVTESNTHRYQVFYFRHDVWRRIAEPALSILKKDMFQDIRPKEATDILDSRRLGFSQLRLLPKGQKLRPIMNLRRRQIGRNGCRALNPSINSVLGPVHTALKFEKTQYPLRLGSTLFSVSDMYAKLKRFKTSLPPSHSSPFFFAKVDVQSAFDTIPQDAIIELMKSVPSQRQYTVTKHAEVQPGERAMVEPEKTATKAIRRWHASALAKDTQIPFADRLQNGLATKRKHTVFIDGVAQRNHDTKALLQLLTDHVERNLVKIGKKYYRQKRGIPQGSVLSSLLCNYFYADLEKKHLGFLLKPDCLLMRLIDDFLLITLDKSKAVQFVETMHRGMPEYGVKVSHGKTMVNFDMRINGEAVCKMPADIGFPYCGTCINDRTLDITKDGGAGNGISVANSLTVEFGRSAGQNFQRKVLNAFKIQSHLMFFDTSHNSPRTVLESLRRAFAETARKMWAYLRCLPKAQQPNSSLITRMFATCIDLRAALAYIKRYGLLLTRSSKSRRLRYPEYSCCIRRGQLNSAAYGAFLEVLGKKQANYGSVIAWLKQQDKRLTVM